ncbi:hypothetical protein PVAP13_9KG309048 [Panicum virgatum]|uniref:Cell differentiation protein rcd1 n=1 Tax=Panicum virgatum TaxID=38727 RepID=A0A8T0N907_PANVG|nr:hypothetical protein PVAP13_9KG309048 [Panicum virgatum]
MANPPRPNSGGSSSGDPSAPEPPAKDKNTTIVERLLLDLCVLERREKTLEFLARNRDKFQQDIAPLLWHSFGTMAVLLQEILSIYRPVAQAKLTQHQSSRVCNALALLQCVASHPDTKMPFINAHIPLYLYPFLNTAYKTQEYEFLRLTSLGVIGALVKVDDDEVIAYLLTSQIIPLCLLTMDIGSEISKTMLDALVEQPSRRLLKHIIRCYLRLTDHPSACDALRTCLPTVLTNGTFNDLLETQKDLSTRLWLHQMLHNIAMASSGHGGPHADLNRIMGR